MTSSLWLKKFLIFGFFLTLQEKMNVSLVEVGGAILLVSQFTLLGDLTKGKRPGFDLAAPPALAKQLYDSLIQQFREKSLYVATGEFGAHMQVTLQNDGPVTFILDSQNRRIPKNPNVK